jgi:hypothetical protein
MRQERTALDTPERKLLVWIPEVARLIDVSRAKASAIAASGDLLSVVKLGGAVGISVDALRDWIKRQVLTAT